MRVYISGPMRGADGNEDPRNLAEFDRVAAIIADLGHTPINPLDLSRELVRNRGLNPGVLTNYRLFSLEDYMEQDIRAMSTCDALVLLPGWTNSKGAAVELAYARYRDIPVYANIDEFEYLVCKRAEAA